VEGRERKTHYSPGRNGKGVPLLQKKKENFLSFNSFKERGGREKDYVGGRGEAERALSKGFNFLKDEDPWGDCLISEEPGEPRSDGGRESQSTLISWRGGRRQGEQRRGWHHDGGSGCKHCGKRG